MIKAELGRQLMIRLSNKVGSLAEVLSGVSALGINVVASCAYAIDSTVAIMFVTEDNNKAKKSLEDKGINVEEEEVILLSIDNNPGALQQITDRIAQEGIDLTFVYGSVAPESKTCLIILISKDNLDVMMLIKTMLERS